MLDHAYNVDDCCRTQLSKAMERFLASKFLPELISDGAFGSNQFAYRPEHGARDAILFLVIKWLSFFATGHRIGVYCSDVSGAFDRVSAKRLLSVSFSILSSLSKISSGN